jgi:hypothetical protein
VRGGRETIIGVSQDPSFGPVIMFGLGGIYVEALKDVTFRMQPVSDIDAREMVRAIRGIKLLEGMRGEPPADLADHRGVIQRLAARGRPPGIIEMDINPFVVFERAASWWTPASASPRRTDGTPRARGSGSRQRSPGGAWKSSGRLWHEVVDSLWFVPGSADRHGRRWPCCSSATTTTSSAIIDAADVWWLFGGSAEGAKSVLESISGSIITVTGVVFSVTIIALQLASSQFTPRVLRQFMADRANQVVLGVFIGTFTYTLLVQRTVRSGEVSDEFIPAVAVTGAVVLALTSIGFLIYYINHAARSIQAAVIIDGAVKDTLRAVQRMFPQRLDVPDAPSPDVAIQRTDEPAHVAARTAGYVQALDRPGLRKLAREKGVTVRLEAGFGGHVLPGQLIMSVWPATALDDELAERCAVR